MKKQLGKVGEERGTRKSAQIKITQVKITKKFSINFFTFFPIIFSICFI